MELKENDSFGRLTVIKRVEDKITPNGTHKAMYLCKCSCGNEKIIQGQSLYYNKTRSCGCYNKEKTSLRFKKHGMKGTKAYSTWYGIKTRCFNKNCERFNDYGGRGITMCKEWKEDFLTFYKDVSELPHAFENGYSIDRINNNGNYEKGNVKFSTPHEQNMNTRRTENGNNCK